MKRFFIGILFCLVSVVCMAQYDQLTNIPTVYIETYGNKSVTSKTTYIYATLTYVDGSNIVQYDSLQIRGRGNSTWNLAKKPYRLKFHESTKFLGKGYAKNKSWTLLANHGDKSLLRNAVTFTMGDFLGQPFSPAAHFVDLVLNGTYLGNYQVSDQVNVDNKRVEVYEQEEVATDTTNITGGYLVEVDGFGTSEEVYFRTNKNLIVSVKSPDEDVINTAQRNYIKQYLNNFESSLFGASFTDPEYGYRAIADSATLMSWYIATELSANVDGFWSTYLYKDQDDPRLYFGPLWDYDIAYNNFLARDFLNLSVSTDGYRCFFTHGIQQVELLVGIVFKIKPDTSSQEDGEEDTDGFGIFAFDDGDDERKERCHQQDTDNGVIEFFEVEFPHGGSFGRGQKVPPIRFSAFLDLFVR